MSLLDDNSYLFDEDFNGEFNSMDKQLNNNICDINCIWDKITLYNKYSDKEINIIKVNCCFLWWILCINLLNIYFLYETQNRKLIIWKE